MTLMQSGATITPDELLLRPDEKEFEIVGGNLVERHVGHETSYINAVISSLLMSFVRSRRLGYVYDSEAGYQCFPDDPHKLRRPDVSFIAAGRLPGNQNPAGYCRIRPDLVVEVISPNDLADEVDHKLLDYESAGVPLVWVIYPRSRRVEIHRPAHSPLGRIARLGESDTISGEDVLPGFSCRVGEFFE